MSNPVDWVASIGRGGFLVLSGTGRLGHFTGTIVATLLGTRPFLREIVRQMVNIGLHSVLIIASINLFIGANVAVVGYSIFKEFGGQDMVGVYVGLSCVLGLAPIIVGAMLGAKPGTEMTATIATMRVKEQIDALEVMAVNPYWYLIVPRFLAFLVVTPPLIIISDFVSLAAGYVVCVYQLGLNPGTYMADVVRFLVPSDLWKGILKGEIFAMMACLVSCFFGYFSAPGPAGVAQAINRAVVAIATAIVIVNYILTEIMY